MNDDEFERQLERQPMRALPGEWREQILSAARSEAKAQPAGALQGGDGGAAVAVERRTWWRQLLWPCPQAWAGLAAVWVVVFGLRLMAGVQPRSAAESTLARSSPEWRALMTEQRQLYAELLGRGGSGPIQPHVEPADRPRSARPEPHRFSTGPLLGPSSPDSMV